MRRIYVPAVLLLLMSGCGSGTTNSGTATASQADPGTGEAAPSSSAPADPAAPRSGVPPIVDADTVPAAARTAYLSGLEKIDPGLVANEDRAIRRATNICLDIAQGKEERIVIDNTVKRLSGGDATIDATQGTEAVALARLHICGLAK